VSARRPGLMVSVRFSPEEDELRLAAPEGNVSAFIRRSVARMLGKEAPPPGCDDFPVWDSAHGYMRCACGKTATGPDVATQESNRQGHYQAVREVLALCR
jgi:hypothetical protein